ncbi:DUF2141 domain-containing protein [Pseudoalteromonas rubra]|uniref:DUF2141 domain-containing protein n=1 Tax=Pseudoalteromonas rubra TaxID=43658 RepID=A0A5S3X597_9GAMM|nr:DUF2141 domain-containing protein [Pseudoalteromonas rubra]TMP39238.1 hypothetical protein CWB98_01230 [Pseudoalteromonas rubra]
MTKHLTRTTAIACILGALSASTMAQDLTITFSGLAHQSGTLKLVAYDSAAGFLQQQAWRVAQQQVSDTHPELTLHDVEPGQYSFMVYQDLNGDGRLNRNRFGLPTEPYGFSNNELLAGIPQFPQLAVQITHHNQNLEIRLR